MNVLFLLTFIGTMALSLWAAAKVKIAYAKGCQVPASSGFTGAEAASRILDAAGIRMGTRLEPPRSTGKVQRSI